MSSFFSAEELKSIGFRKFGTNVLISRYARIYGAERIEIGNHVRVDDFCMLSAGSGGIHLGNFIHISAYTSLVGAGKITMEDFSGISSRVSVFSSNDDYFGAHLTNPMVSSEFTGVSHADVTISRHCLIGSGSVILPGVTLQEGAVVGALSLVQEDCDSFYIYSGNPLKKLMRRSKKLLQLESEFLKTIKDHH